MLGEFLKKGAAGSTATRTGNDQRRKRTQSHCLKNFLSNDHLSGSIATGLGGERHPDGVADALLKENRQRGSRCNDALAAHTCFGQADMQRVIAATGEFAIDRHHILNIRYLGREDDGIASKTKRFGLTGAVDGRGDQRFAHHLHGIEGLGARGIFVHQPGQQGLIETAPVDADANRLVMHRGHFDHLSEVTVTTTG